MVELAAGKGRGRLARLGGAFARSATAARPPLLFGLRLWASVCLALYVSYWLELDNPFWAGTTAAIVCQPQLGASLRKGWFRMIGTLIGAIASVVLTACFIQDRIGFLLCLALLGAASAFVATILRNFAAYAAALASYTVAIIAADILGATGGARGDVFAFAIARTTEISIGIVSAGIVLAGTDFGGAQRELAKLFAGLIAKITSQFTDTLNCAAPEAAEKQAARRELVRQTIELDPLIDQAIGESSELRVQSTVLWTAVDGLLATLAAWRAIAVRLGRPPRDEARQDADAILRAMPDELLSAFEGGVAEIWANAPNRLEGMIAPTVGRLESSPAVTPSLRLLSNLSARVLAGISDALSAMALLSSLPAWPQSRRHAVLHQVPDWLPAFLNAARAFLAIGAAALFWIATAWPNGAFGMTFAAIVVTLFAPTGEQVVNVSLSFMIGNVFAAVLAAIVKFAALPAVDTFAGFSLILGLYLVPVGALIAQPWQRAMFTAMGVNFVPLLGPANLMTYDTIQYYNTALAIIVGSGMGVLAFYLVPPLSPAVRTQRLLALTLRDLRRIAMGDAQSARESWQARIFARLAVFPDSAQPVQRSELLTALFVGAEIIELRRLAPALDLERELSAAFVDLARANSAEAAARLAEIDRYLASLSPSAVGLEARASILAISDALAEHATYFDAGAPA